jgi:hypothetical protein
MNIHMNEVHSSCESGVCDNILNQRPTKFLMIASCRLRDF